jgi:hypothetical protein
VPAPGGCKGQGICESKVEALPDIHLVSLQCSSCLLLQRDEHAGLGQCDALLRLAGLLIEALPGPVHQLEDRGTLATSHAGAQHKAQQMKDSSGVLYCHGMNIWKHRLSFWVYSAQGRISLPLLVSMASLLAACILLPCASPPEPIFAS